MATGSNNYPQLSVKSARTVAERKIIEKEMNRIRVKRFHERRKALSAESNGDWSTQQLHIHQSVPKDWVNQQRSGEMKIESTLPPVDATAHLKLSTSARLLPENSVNGVPPPGTTMDIMLATLTGVQKGMPAPAQNIVTKLHVSPLNAQFSGGGSSADAKQRLSVKLAKTEAEKEIIRKEMNRIRVQRFHRKRKATVSSTQNVSGSTFDTVFDRLERQTHSYGETAYMPYRGGSKPLPDAHTYGYPELSVKMASTPLERTQIRRLMNQIRVNRFNQRKKEAVNRLSQSLEIPSGIARPSVRLGQTDSEQASPQKKNSGRQVRIESVTNSQTVTHGEGSNGGQRLSVKMGRTEAERKFILKEMNRRRVQRFNMRKKATTTNATSSSHLNISNLKQPVRRAGTCEERTGVAECVSPVQLKQHVVTPSPHMEISSHCYKFPRPMDVSAMSPSKIREHLESSREPLLLENFINHWPSSEWNPTSLGQSQMFLNMPFLWRVGKRKSRDGGTLWEKDCQYVSATISQFDDHTKGKQQIRGSEGESLPENSWLYADYKHLADLVDEDSEIMQSIDWGVFGYPDRNGMQSTLWIGSASAETSRHYDTYGCNLVAQLYGRKRWILNSPNDSTKMQPTRIPYEESSVFSKSSSSIVPEVDSYVVDLAPGQVLFVPKHWWHSVQCLETCVSVNTWIELDSDAKDRCREAMTSLLTAAITEYSDLPVSEVYNPKELLPTSEESLMTIRHAFCTPEKINHSKTKDYILCKCCPRAISTLPTISKEPSISPEASNSRAGEQTMSDILRYITHPEVVNLIVRKMEEDKS